MELMTFIKIILALYTLWALLTNIRVNKQDKEIKRLKGYIDNLIKDELIKTTNKTNDDDQSDN